MIEERTVRPSPNLSQCNHAAFFQSQHFAEYRSSRDQPSISLSSFSQNKGSSSRSPHFDASKTCLYMTDWNSPLLFHFRSHHLSCFLCDRRRAACAKTQSNLKLYVYLSNASPCIHAILYICNIASMGMTIFHSMSTRERRNSQKKKKKKKKTIETMMGKNAGYFSLMEDITGRSTLFRFSLQTAMPKGMRNRGKNQ